MTRRLEGRPVAEGIEGSCRARVEAGRAKGWPPPTLASVHIGEGTPFQVYLKRQEKAAAAVGIRFVSVPLAAGTRPAALVARLAELDGDPAIDAVLLQHPLPPPLDFLEAVSRLSPSKDVDGVGAPNLGRLAQHRPVHVPAVARAALAICKHYGIALAGRPVTVLGRSETVGTPLVLLLLARGLGAEATVTVAHSHSRDLRAALAGAEVIFSCTGRPGTLTREVVPRGASVIDIGLSTVPDRTRPSGMRSVGDAEPALDGWVEALTPVPGGVGPVTVAELMESAVRAWEMHHGVGQ